jgi:hypothetical protein
MDSNFNLLNGASRFIYNLTHQDDGRREQQQRERERDKEDALIMYVNGIKKEKRERETHTETMSERGQVASG